MLGAQELIKADEKQMRGGLWISGINFVDKPNNLAQKNINAICSVLGSNFPNVKNKQIAHKCIELEDHHEVEYEQFRHCCEEAYTFIEKSRTDNKNVVVHCRLGVSRSAAICVYYLMRKQQLSYQKAVNRIKIMRPSIRINKGFQFYLSELQKQLVLKSNSIKTDIYPKPSL